MRTNTFLGVICPKKKKQIFSSHIHLKLRTMSKAEKFIRGCTRNCSNTTYLTDDIENPEDYIPWLTPDQARRAVEIAREETIDNVVEWLKKNVTYIHPRKGTKECLVNIIKLKDALK